MVVWILGILIIFLYLYAIPSGIIVRDSITYLTSSIGDMSMYVPVEYAYTTANPILISLTTSPTRLRQGITKTLDLVFSYTNVRVILSLPKLYRNEESYPEDCLRILQDRYNEKLIIHWCDIDVGPQLKLLGALDFAKLHDCERYILVIDDDVLYHHDLCKVYDSYINQFKNVDVFGAKEESIYGIPIHPGFSSFLVDRTKLPEYFPFLVQQYASVDQTCKRHDDFLFGAIFQDLALKMKHVKISGPLSLPIGFSSDALHTTELSVKKHFLCARAIWSSRRMCPISRVTTNVFTYGPR